MYKRFAGSHLELLEIRRHPVVLVCFALAPLPVMLAGGLPSALPALAAYPIVLSDGPTSASIASAPQIRKLHGRAAAASALIRPGWEWTITGQ